MIKQIIVEVEVEQWLENENEKSFDTAELSESNMTLSSITRASNAKKHS